MTGAIWLLDFVEIPSIIHFSGAYCTLSIKIRVSDIQIQYCAMVKSTILGSRIFSVDFKNNLTTNIYNFTISHI